MKKIKYISLVLLLLTVVSCNSWLDVTDTDVIPEEDLFKTEKGHKQQLTGVYNVMANLDTYGLLLTTGFPDAIAQYWEPNSSSREMADFVEGDYKTLDAEKILYNAWMRQYEAIGNVNILLEKLGETNTRNFVDYDLMKGEALALRAFLHFDLLRLFGPVVKNSPQDLSVPYRTKFDNKTTKRLSGSEVMTLVERDLLAAKVLLANDPIIVNGRKNENISDKSNMAMNFRGIRMNYYAVVATLARLYQLQDNADQAYECAMEVINAKTVKGDKIFPLLLRNDIIGDRPDIMFSKETVFALYDRNIERKYGAFWRFKDDAVQGLTTLGAAIDDKMKEAIYVTPANSSGADHRLNRWFGVFYNFGVFVKHKPLKETWNSNAFDPIISLIRISEMYYIAAEAKIGKNNELALSLLNEVRVTRELQKIGSVPSDGELRDELFNECRKEYIGEGQLFYYYKRLFKDMKTISSTIPASVTRFVLPIPKEEAEFGNN